MKLRLERARLLPAGLPAVHLAALGLYLALALFVLANVLPRLAHAIPGAGVAAEDGWQNTWNLWWVRTALARGQNPFHTDMLFAPGGASLYLHTLNITNALLTLPAQLLAGPVAAYNVAALLGFVLTGYAAFLLALHVIGRPAVALAVGAIVAFSPFHLAKLYDGHLSWVTMQWIPLAVLCLLRALDRGGWRWRFAAGLVLAVATLTSWYYAVFSEIFVALLAAVRAPQSWRAGGWRREAATLLAVALVAGLLLSPVLVPALVEYRSGQLAPPRYPPQEGYGPVWDGETSIYSADLLDMFFPSFLHPLWGQWSAQLHQAMRPGWFWQIAPGYALLALALAGAWFHWREARRWVVLAGALWLLTLGPRLRVLGHNTGVVLPFDWLQIVPGMTLGHRPNHLMIFLLPVLALLAGYGMRALAARGRRGKVALALLCALLVAEYATAPLPALALPESPAAAALRGGSGAVLDLPPDKRTARAMVDQMAHGRPIVGGYLARQPDVPPLVVQSPAVRALWRMEPGQGPDIVENPPDLGRQALSYYGIRAIVLREGALSAEQQQRALRAIEAALPGARPAEQRDGIRIYQVEPAGQPRPFLALGAGWMEAEDAAPRVWRWMGASAQVLLVNPAPASRLVRVELEATSYQRARPLTLRLGGRLVGTFTVPPTERTLRLALALPAGEHTLELASDTEREAAAPHRELSLLFTRIAVLP
jgi:hypothetical protein